MLLCMLLYTLLYMLLYMWTVYITVYVTIYVTVYVPVYVTPTSQLSAAVQLWKQPNPQLPQRVMALSRVRQNCRS